jgi:Predicted drug exporters of the RND superfamily
MQRPISVIFAVCIVLALLGWPIFSLNIGTSNVGTLPLTSEARTGVTILTAQYPDYDQNPVLVVATATDSSDMLTASNLQRVATLTTWLAQQPHVESVVSIMRPPSAPGSPVLSQQQLLSLYSTGTYKHIPALAQFVSSTTADGLTVVSVRSDTKLDSNAGKAQIDHFRTNKTVVQGLTLQVGGVQATYLDFDRFLYSNFPKAIFFIIIVTFVLLMVMFRSLLIPLKAVVMNALSVSVSYGVLVFVFQWGHLSRILDFTSNGFIDSLIPILLFCTLFGLSMDYEVFLLSRIREEWLLSHNNRLAVARGLEKTGSIITNAALLFVIVTVAFTFTQLIVTKQIGLGMTVAILVDATIIRSLLVPATMRLLGRWNWWLPGRPLPPEQKI